MTARVRLQEYNKGKSTWAAMPGTMIRKVAIAQAFREAFPMAVEGMYIPEEMPDEQSAEPMPEANQIKPVFTEADAPAPQEPAEAPNEAPQDAPAPEQEAEPIPAPEAPTEPVNEPQEEKLPWEGDQNVDDNLFKA